VQALGGVAESWAVAVRDSPGHGDEHCPVEQGLAVVGLNRLPAVVACLSCPALDGVGPARTETAAEVASHEHMFAPMSSGEQPFEPVEGVAPSFPVELPARLGLERTLRERNLGPLAQIPEIEGR
jgi:hypothetical protein